MHLAGIPVRDQAILDLARLVDNPLLADKLESAHGPDLAELRGVLLRELEWRRAEGLT
jgi:hypothetical protein